MRVILILITLSFSQLAIAQVEVTVSNPEPRVGQKFILEFSGNFLNEYLAKNLPAELTTSKDIASTIDREILSTKEGKITIGPFSIKLNGKSYKTNSVIVNVQPALEMKEGFWIRRMIKDNYDMILLEQIVSITPVKEVSPGNIKITWESNDNAFASLIADTDFDGIEFQSWGSGSGGSPNELVKWPQHLRYSYKFYRIVKSDTFTKPLKLTSKHFENLKDDVVLPELVIN